MRHWLLIVMGWVALTIGLSYGLERHSFRFHRTPPLTIHFNRFPDLRLTISENCGSTPAELANKGCRAYQAYLKIRNGLASDLEAQFGQNVGALICAGELRDLGGSIEYGTDEKNNQNTFCAFGDGSMIDNGSLAGAFYRQQR